MSPRWNWDFEDEQRGARIPVRSPLKKAPQIAHGMRIRRRRFGAALAFAVLVIVVAVALAGSHGRGSASPSGVPRGAHRAPSPAPATSADTLERGRKAVTSVLAYAPFVRQGGDRGHDVALTFDDGPGPYTPGVLNALEQARATATFFPIGAE